MGPWEEKPKCAKIESGEKHCQSHCWLPIMKSSRLYIQNISQHIPFHTSIPILTQALLRLARKILRLAGEGQQPAGSRASTTGRHGVAAAGAPGRSLRVVALLGGKATTALPHAPTGSPEEVVRVVRP